MSRKIYHALLQGSTDPSSKGTYVIRLCMTDIFLLYSMRSVKRCYILSRLLSIKILVIDIGNGIGTAVRRLITVEEINRSFKEIGKGCILELDTVF